MSRFFKRTEKANGGVPERPSRDSQALDVEKLLETIHQTADDQLSGLESSLRVPKLEAVLDAVQESPSGACDVVEFPTERYSQIRVSRSAERVFFPEDETTPAPPALEAYRSFRARLLRLQAKRHFQTVAVSSAAPNEGKTLTTANLALCCAQLPQFPVLIVDGDLRTRGISKLLGHDGAPGLAELLSGTVACEKAVLATDIPNLHVLPAGDAIKSPPELFSGALWKEFIVWCKQDFKLVLVDCPPVLPLADFDLISAACEALLLVVRERVTDREALQKVLAHVETTKLIGVSLNSVDRNDHKPYEYYYYASRK